MTEAVDTATTTVSGTESATSEAQASQQQAAEQGQQQQAQAQQQEQKPAVPDAYKFESSRRATTSAPRLRPNGPACSRNWV